MLIYILWFLFFAFFVLNTLLLDIKYEYSHFKYQQQATVFLFEAIAIANHFIKDKLVYVPFKNLNQLRFNKNFTITYNKRKYKVTIEPETSKYPIRFPVAKTNELITLFTNLGFSEKEAVILTNSILDFQDPDNLIRFNGAESEYYKQFGYEPKNKPIDSLQELLWIKGFNEDIYNKIKPYITIYAELVNINFAEKPILKALGFSDSEILIIEQYREQGKPISIFFLKNMLGPERWRSLNRRVELSLVPSILRVVIEEETTNMKVILIIRSNGELIDVLWL